MYLYRLQSQSRLLLLIVTQLLLINETSQSATQDIDLNKSNPLSSQHQDVATTFASPFIVLMSNDTISIAQLPMITYGNLTDIYRLDAEPGAGEDSTSFARDQHPSESSDARDHGEHQMLHSRKDLNGNITTTTTSLGKKSEWQQIAAGGNDRKEALLPATQTTDNRKEDDAREKEEEAGVSRAAAAAAVASTQQMEGNEKQSSLRPRRSEQSNSFSHHNDHDDGLVVEQDESYASQLHTSRSIIRIRGRRRVNRAEESSLQNVTSAAQNDEHDNVQQHYNQPNLELHEEVAGAGIRAEDGDKISQSLFSPKLPRASPLPSAGTVQFSDIDVHMLLGYAFVADSIGRIHRFRLTLNGPTQSNAAQANAIASARSSLVGEIVSNDENVGNDGGNGYDDETNSIRDATTSASKFEFALHQSKASSGSLNFNTAKVAATIGVGTTTNNHDDNYDSRVTNNAQQHTTSATNANVNKVSIESNNAFTHEQSGAGERQHPTISGQESFKFTRDDAPISGELTSPPPVVSLRQNRFSSRDSYLDEASPRIIWSRNKYVTSNLLSLKDSSSAVPRWQQLANVVRGASPPFSTVATDATAASPKEHQSTNARSSSSSNESADDDDDSESDSDHSDNEQFTAGNTNSATCDGANWREGNHQMRTEIAVDWLNNLLFVLDKCRLLVVDFDGNNELVLIDDFNVNNRPIDIKVDPANDFLFWLQVGKFHNTIYKLDLSVLSMPSATQKLVGNALRLRQSAALAANTSDSVATNFDAASDLLPLVSHHYAHPIITNLPRSAKIFTIDHKHSKIYVPLSRSTGTVSSTDGSNVIEQDKRGEAEVFALSDDITHLNNTDTSFSSVATDISSASDETSRLNCSHSTSGEQQQEFTDHEQVLAFNLDGTDVGPMRTVNEKSHITSLDDIQDMTLDSKSGLLYWLTNNGRDLFEELKENTTIQPAQHNLGDKSYLKLIYFDSIGSNQPRNQKANFNVRKIIHALSSSISSHRPVRSDVDITQSFEDNSAFSLRVRHSEIDNISSRFSQSAPYILLGVTCLLVVTVYLIYALVFQQLQRASSAHNHTDGTISESSSMDIESNHNPCTSLHGFVDSNTITGWVAGPSMRSTTDTSMFNRDLSSKEEKHHAYDLGSTSYVASNAIDEHYRDSIAATSQHHSFMDQSNYSTSKLANLSQWPSNLHDLSNKLYVPVEVLQDETLSSIRRVSIDQLEIEKTTPLGEGHFGTVLQGIVKCLENENEKSYLPLVDRSQIVLACNGPMSPDSLAPPSQSRAFAPSSTSSGHGSSSSTSCEFATANSVATETNTNNDDYLTPKLQLNSLSSDYCDGIREINSSHNDSLSGYSEPQHDDTIKVETKIRVAIKKLKDNASAEEKRDFLQEAKLLANFDHPNIVHLIGICLDRGSTLIVMELMLGGDLIRYMQQNMPNSVRNYSENLTYEDLLKICLDIANGCCYLEDLDYIHRDLAARNCLVSSRKREERVVKLADFGLARDIYKDSYYKKLNDSAMPLKWMAPECLIEQKFTKKSDVWSFGVVMWEVMSYCQEKPYSCVEPFFMKEHLASGARLRKPDYCDDQMYKLMNQCWQMEPENRPTFHECRGMLIEFKNRLGHRV